MPPKTSLKIYSFKSWKFYSTYIIHITSIFKHSYYCQFFFVLLKNINFIKNEYLKLQAKYKDVVLLKLQKSIKI